MDIGIAPAALPAPMSEERKWELLGILQEECSEVIQEVSKGRRFLLDTEHPTLGTPRQRLTIELGDLICVMKLLTDAGELNIEEIFARAREKKLKLLANLKSAP